MINSLCGSSLSLKNENSRNKLQQNSLNDNKKNATQTQPCDDLDQITILTPQSLNLPSLKFDLDGDVEIQSPDSSMWESFFSDQLDGDFMISSPIRNNFPNSPQASNYNCNNNNNNNYAQIGALNNTSNQKMKGLSPLHRVFNSPNNQYMQHVENLSLPAIEEFLEDYQGYSSTTTTKVSSSECYDMETPISTILDSLTMQNSSSYNCGNSSSQLTQESDHDIYQQMGSMASASLSQALQQERYQEKHQKLQAQQQLQQQQQQSLTVPIPIGSEQVIN